MPAAEAIAILVSSPAGAAEASSARSYRRLDRFEDYETGPATPWAAIVDKFNAREAEAAEASGKPFFIPHSILN